MNKKAVGRERGASLQREERRAEAYGHRLRRNNCALRQII